ncbi:MAG: site-specific DNA-methyltransferase, partial [Nitrosopumilus sp.]|nr:site-specific DNA-methyltransferase [Nitrosopumilus sp.]
VPSVGTLIPDKKESVNFDGTENIFIEGENLEVLKLLQKSYSGKIKMIYIDPPYNTGNDFVYKDNFENSVKSYLEKTEQSKSGIILTSNPESSGRFHSDWISFMYPRLFLARELLKTDGVIFISIGDNEVQNLKIIMNEIFGEENFISTIIWQKNYSPRNDAKYFSEMHDYILCYAKNKISNNEIGWKRNLLPRTVEQNNRYTNRDNDPRGLWKPENLTAKRYTESDIYPIITPSGRSVLPSKGRSWVVSKEKLQKLIKDNRIWFGENGDGVPSKKNFLSEVQQGSVPVTIWFRDVVGDNQDASRELKSLFENPPFETPKPTRLIKQILELSTSTDSEDIVLDFFAGSGTTAHSIINQNILDCGTRKFILVQIPEKCPDGSLAKKEGYHNISEISKERIRRIIKKIKADEKQQKLDTKLKQDLGFKVFKLAKSNYKIWEDVKDETKLKEQLKLFEDPLIKNYNDIDVLYEIILKEGYSLNSKIETFREKPNKIYKVSDDEFFFYVTLDKKLDEKSIQNLNLDQNTMFVCLDSALDDSQKTNLNKLCKLKMI